MLVLSRKLNEKIVIDGGITITVVKIDRNQVRIGIQAPSNVAVMREELVSNAVKTRPESARVEELELAFVGADACTA
jgi:carbon storage regulator